MNTTWRYRIAVSLFCGAILLNGARGSALLISREPIERASVQPCASADDTKKRDVQVENIEGSKTSLSQFQGRVVALVLSGKESGEAGVALMQEIALGSAKETELAYVLVADLRSAPGLFRGQIRGMVKNRMKRQGEKLQTAFRKAGLTYEARHAPTILLDWNGNVAKQFSLSGSPDAAYRVLILDRKGNIAFQYAQPKSSKSSPPPTSEILKGLKATLSDEKTK